MRWAHDEVGPAPAGMLHFAGHSAGSYSATALEVEYRLLCKRRGQPLSPRRRYPLEHSAPQSNISWPSSPLASALEHMHLLQLSDTIVSPMYMRTHCARASPLSKPSVCSLVLVPWMVWETIAQLCALAAPTAPCPLGNQSASWRPLCIHQRLCSR